jgi:hypothetical protein
MSLRSLRGCSHSPSVEGVPHVAVFSYSTLNWDPRWVSALLRSMRRGRLLCLGWVVQPTLTRRGALGLLHGSLLEQHPELLVYPPSFGSVGLGIVSEEEGRSGQVVRGPAEDLGFRRGLLVVDDALVDVARAQ